MPNPASCGPTGQPHEQLHARQGAKRPAKLPVGCSGSRVRLPLLASLRAGAVNSRSMDIEPSAARSGKRTSSLWKVTNCGFTLGEA